MVLYKNVPKVFLKVVAPFYRLLTVYEIPIEITVVWHWYSMSPSILTALLDVKLHPIVILIFITWMTNGINIF